MKLPCPLCRLYQLSSSLSSVTLSDNGILAHSRFSQNMVPIHSMTQTHQITTWERRYGSASISTFNFQIAWLSINLKSPLPHYKGRKRPHWLGYVPVTQSHQGKRHKTTYKLQKKCSLPPCKCKHINIINWIKRKHEANCEMYGWAIWTK